MSCSTSVLEEHVVSIFKVEEYTKQGKSIKQEESKTTRYIPVELLITTAVRTPNTTHECNFANTEEQHIHKKKQTTVYCAILRDVCYRRLKGCGYQQSLWKEL